MKLSTHETEQILETHLDGLAMREAEEAGVNTIMHPEQREFNERCRSNKVTVNCGDGLTGAVSSRITIHGILDFDVSRGMFLIEPDFSGAYCRFRYPDVKSISFRADGKPFSNGSEVYIKIGF